MTTFVGECREAFERWASAQGYGCHKYSCGAYRAIEWQQNWVGFQAAWKGNSKRMEAIMAGIEKNSFVETDQQNRLVMTEDVLRIIGSNQ